jgi:uncharacterized protein YhaN
MSDKDRDEYDPPQGGESEHEWMQRQTSPELRWLDLFHRLTTRVEANESRVKTNEEDYERRVEEMQRNMDFIVRQQAQFSADVERLREMQEHSEQRWVRIERMWERTEESVRSLHAIAQIHEGEITALAEAQAQTASQMAETDERINALVNTVERIISERRNGGGKTQEGSE